MGYFDDLPCMGKTFETFCTSLDLLLKQLEKYNLKARIEKCSFGQTELEFLGHIVSGEGIKPSPKKIEALQKMPYLHTMKQLQSQLGFFNYFSRFIPNFATHAPLYRLITKERKFKITQEDRKALDYMKKLLIEATLLVHFDPTRKIKMAVDASNVAVGGILMQEDNKGDPPEELKWTPIYYLVNCSKSTKLTIQPQKRKH